MTLSCPANAGPGKQATDRLTVPDGALITVARPWTVGVALVVGGRRQP